MVALLLYLAGDLLQLMYEVVLHERAYPTWADLAYLSFYPVALWGLVSIPGRRLGPERFFSGHGFAPATTYELAWEQRLYPPKAILGTAYEFATGQRLGSSEFEGGKTGAVRVLGQLGFTVQEKRRPPR